MTIVRQSVNIANDIKGAIGYNKGCYYIGFFNTNGIHFGRGMQ